MASENRSECRTAKYYFIHDNSLSMYKQPLEMRKVILEQ